VVWEPQVQPEAANETQCLAKIKSSFEMTNLQRGCVTCYKEQVQLLWSFGEGAASNCHKLLRSKAAVVNVMVKRRDSPIMSNGSIERAQSTSPDFTLL
jgi:hypothetical protein